MGGDGGKWYVGGMDVGGHPGKTGRQGAKMSELNSGRLGPGSAVPQMSLLGHDLRAAMSDIIGGLRLIRQDRLDEETRLQLERIRAAGESLARLLEEGLSLLPGEDGVSDAHPTDIHCGRLLYDVEMRWSGRARERGLTFVMDVAEDLPRMLSLERIALERILSNLLSNAIKYTDRGRVTLHVWREEETLFFAVEDDGPGFSEEALRRLFRYQGRPAQTTKPGVGLGLHITKEMADRLGGTVSVVNGRAGGAVVTLALPGPAWQAKPEAGSAPPGELPDLGGLSVLLAEDSRTNQTILSRMLETMGAEVTVASDGVEAMERLRAERFDLALIDIEMPRMTGIEVIKALRAMSGPMARMPVLAVTAYVLRSNRLAIYAAGADMILAKPIISIEPFAQAVDAVRRAASAPAPQPADTTHLPLMDDERFAQLLRIAGPEGRRELLARLHTDLTDAERGLVHGLAAGDSAAIRGHTHVLIALAGAVGAIRLQKCCDALNAAVHRQDEGATAEFGAEALQLLDHLISRIGQENQLHGERG